MRPAREMGAGIAIFSRVLAPGSKLAPLSLCARCKTKTSKKSKVLMENIPGWVVWMVGIANFFIIFAAIGLVALAVVGVGILLSIKDLVQTELRKDILPSVASTLRNVEKISTDAADTTHNVTGAVNRVSNLIGGAANRLESPVIRAVGMAAGLLSGVRAMKGGKPKRTEVIVEKKKKGFFG